jgi:hypothetical protein
MGRIYFFGAESNNRGGESMDYPKRVIQSGESNARIVKAIQTRLVETGATAGTGGSASGAASGVPSKRGSAFAVNGVYGPKTTAAVKLFQSTHRDQMGNPLTMDGKVGAITWAILFGLDKVPVQEDGGTGLLAEAVKVAATQVGVMETPEGSNGGPEVDAYLASVGLGTGFYWCASFVYWCFRTAAANLGRANPVFKTAGCLNHWNKTQGRKIPAAEAVANPGLVKPGHIFILNHGAGMGHTGLVESVEGGFLHTIEGNSDPEGGSNGIGVFRLERKIAAINQGFIVYR